MDDATLNRLFAEKVAGWTRVCVTTRIGNQTILSGYNERCREFNLGPEPVPDFLNDANAVLPWLEKQGYEVAHVQFLTCVVVWVNRQPFGGKAKHFARAAVFALLKAAGVEITP